MGYWDAPEDQTVPSRSVWYVQTGLTRALDMTLDQVYEYERLAENENREESVRDSFRGFADYQRQWLREAQEYFTNLPADLQPHREVMMKVRHYFDQRAAMRRGE